MIVGQTSVLTRPDQMGIELLDLYEVHLKEHFLSRMRSEQVQEVRKSCVTWKTCPLSGILQHAEHVEEQLQGSEARKTQARERKLEEAQLAMFNAGGPPQTQYQRASGRARNGYGGGRCRSRMRGDPDTCHCCGKRGHWKAECPLRCGKPVHSGSD
ncbi:hypothetical protein PAMP_014753 [Pampus punctatissimus]